MTNATLPNPWGQLTRYFFSAELPAFAPRHSTNVAVARRAPGRRGAASELATVDACGAWNLYEAEAAMSRMASAGAELVTTFTLACELLADWKLPTANAMFGPFNENLSEYGSVIQNSWNDANEHVVQDPFGMVSE